MVEWALRWMVCAPALYLGDAGSSFGWKTGYPDVN